MSEADDDYFMTDDEFTNMHKFDCDKCGAKDLTWSAIHAGRMLNEDGTPHVCKKPEPTNEFEDFLE